MRAKLPRILQTLPLVTAALSVAVTFAFAAPVFAEQTAAQLTQDGLKATAKTGGLGDVATPLPEIVGNIIYGALSLTGIIFVILIIYGGFIWMQARGNTEDVQKAKKIIESAIIGIVIIALAFAITNFVIDRLTEAQGGQNAGQAANP
ncbi:MAG: pilin [bacterium]|nr:pilin [bacterium]